METVLGLDLGVNSLGWATIGFEKGKPTRIQHLGVRIFPAGLDDLEKDGKGSPKNAERRSARQIRRQLERRTHRKNKLFHALQRAGLLPAYKATEMEVAASVRHNTLQELDLNLLQEYGQKEHSERFFHFLRTQALDHELHLHTLGRVLYHLGQHRGFLSNRKADSRDNESSTVLAAIRDLKQAMERENQRTLGEYLYHEKEGHRLRARWTSRQMYLDEFDAIWTSQQRFYPEILSQDLREELHECLFKQRPLRSQKHLIGRCELEPQKHRCAIGMPAAQRFRLLQKVNDLELIDRETGEVIELSLDKRALLIEHLETKGDLKFTQLRRMLGNRHLEVNLERGGDKALIGNRTIAKLNKAAPDLMQRLSPEEIDKLATELLTIEQQEAMQKRALGFWQASVEEADNLASLTLENGYANLSLKAIRTMLPDLKKGIHLATALKTHYGHIHEDDQVYEALPPVSKAFPSLRNPIVSRALTQLRLVVNSYIQKHGLPDKIRIELVRSLKQTASRREETIKRNRSRERERDQARTRLLQEAGIANPSRSDIEKLLLADECDWTCPYTGEHFGMSDLFNGRVEVEHIIPRSRSLNNSFMNKTLCMSNENKSKGRQTPHEAYAGHKERYSEILERVKGFNSDFARGKLKLFQLKTDEVADLLDDFAESQLVDTAYATRLAGQYLGKLYGGEIDSGGKRRVEKIAGRATALLRGAWNMNSILSDGPRKSRDDHRHHVVDALVVAVSSPAHVRALSKAMERSEDEGQRIANLMEEPWPGFQMECSARVLEVVPSHKVNRRIRSGLHNESNFSPRRDTKGRPTEEGEWVHIRKPIESLDKLDAVVDPAIRELLIAAKAEHGNRWNKDEACLPSITTAKGERRPIRHVRIRKKTSTQQVGQGHRERHVETGGNHHLEVFETTNARGQLVWDGVMVSTFEANRRRLLRLPVFNKEHGPGTRYLFSLQQGDCFYLKDDPECEGVQIIRSLDSNFSGSGPRIFFVHAKDARKLTEIKADRNPVNSLKGRSMNALRTRLFNKLHIGLLGEVSGHGSDS